MRTLSMDVQTGEFVQILNMSQTHWINISTIGCRVSFIKVYDSGGKYITYRNKEEIASLLCTPEHTITVEFMNVQTQVGAQDFSLFAVAYTPLQANQRAYVGSMWVGLAMVTVYSVYVGSMWVG